MPASAPRWQQSLAQQPFADLPQAQPLRPQLAAALSRFTWACSVRSRSCLDGLGLALALAPALEFTMLLALVFTLVPALSFALVPALVFALVILCIT